MKHRSFPETHQVSPDLKRVSRKVVADGSTWVLVPVSNWMEGPCVLASMPVCEEKAASKDISHSARSSVFWKGRKRLHAYPCVSVLMTFAYCPEAPAGKDLTNCLQKNQEIINVFPRLALDNSPTQFLGCSLDWFLVYKFVSGKVKYLL